MDGLHHQCQHRIEELACFLGISVGEQLHRPLEVGEEDGDLLALAFEGRPRVEDLLGEMLRGICPRRSEAGCGRSRNRLPALEAKLRAGRQGALTLGACEREICSALQTKLSVRRVFVLATWKIHESCPNRPRHLRVSRVQKCFMALRADDIHVACNEDTSFELSHSASTSSSTPCAEMLTGSAPKRHSPCLASAVERCFRLLPRDLGWSALSTLLEAQMITWKTAVSLVARGGTTA